MAATTALPSPAATLSPEAAQRAAKARKTAQDFEAVFLQQMLKPMFETAEPGIFSGGYAEEQWRGLLTEEYAKSFAAAGGIGIADIVQREMLKLQEARP